MWSLSYKETPMRGGVGCQGCHGSQWVALDGQWAMSDRMSDRRHVNEGSEEASTGIWQSTCDLIEGEGGADPLLLLLSRFSCVQLCATP